jgi:transcriptional regulator of acetoin/glycerol metabolism
MKITFNSLNLVAAERLLCEAALGLEGTINGAAAQLGISRHAFRRLIIKHNLRWPRPSPPVVPELP